LPLTERLRLTCGVRVEDVRMKIESLKGETVERDTMFSGSLWFTEPFPSVALRYTPRARTNFRFSFARTYDLPTFREIGPYASTDPAIKENQVGNPDLLPSIINSTDFGWEWFVAPGEFIAVGAFVKSIRDPIVEEPLRFTSDEQPQRRWENSSDGWVYGTELEFRKSLDFIYIGLADLSVGGNLTLMKSKVQRTLTAVDVRSARSENPSEPTRPLYASPYVINAGMAYDNEALGLGTSVYFNVFGRRVVHHNLYGGPDLIEHPRPELNFTFEKAFKRNAKVKLAAKNLLNPEYKEYREYKDDVYTQYTHRGGVSISVGLSYTL
ncbi:MAG: TonB-dependent receptor, partial [Chitinivibrionales bacterium]|nr:TonB-dependent receptor [Chitinivibrionales bacterium]MBD3357204.1 TonB-dependent receptor [Chitinivibrionales bacterium]